MNVDRRTLRRFSFLILFGWHFTGGIQIDSLRGGCHTEGPAAGTFRKRGFIHNPDSPVKFSGLRTDGTEPVRSLFDAGGGPSKLLRGAPFGYVPLCRL
jgi:hypothetical protein